MRPFVTGKATPDRLNDRLLRRFEKQGADKIEAALAKLQRDLFRGINQSNAAQMVSRLDDPKVMQPFEDAITALVQEWALAGADNGRVQVEREIFGTV